MKKTLIPLVALLIAASLGWSDDLAALAKKEKERRAKVAKPVKVLGEDDAKAAAAKGTGSLTLASGEAASAGSEGSEGTPAQGKSDRDQWKQRADALKATIVSATGELDRLEQEAAAFRSDVAPLTAAEAQDPMRLQKREAKLAEMAKNIQKQTAAVAAAKKAQSDFEDEARKAGIPAGWLR